MSTLLDNIEVRLRRKSISTHFRNENIIDIENQFRKSRSGGRTSGTNRVLSGNSIVLPKLIEIGHILNNQINIDISENQDTQRKSLRIGIAPPEMKRNNQSNGWLRSSSLLRSSRISLTKIDLIASTELL